MIDYVRIFREAYDNTLRTDFRKDCQGIYSNTDFLSAVSNWINRVIVLEAPQTYEFVKIYYSQKITMSDVAKKFGVAPPEIRRLRSIVYRVIEENYKIICSFPELSYVERVQMGMYDKILISELLCQYSGTRFFSGAINTLRDNNIITVYDVINYPNSLKMIQGIGDKTVRILNEELAKIGSSLKVKN